MGYGFGGFLVVVGLILALAVQDRVKGIDLVMVGWIAAAVGVALILLNATSMMGRRSRTVDRTTYPDGSQTVRERRTDI